MTTLVEVRAGEAACAQLHAWLDAAAPTTSDLAESRPRDFAPNDASGDPLAEAHRVLGDRIRLFASLPIEKLDGPSLKREMDAIGRTADQTASSSAA